ncbi:phage terminase large subunit [Bacillus sp. 0102A]|uniref:phage terminase large subunit n=1 Tax=Bacillus sp. 0102A TaxID=3120563 RepID=UPI002FD963FC
MREVYDTHRDSTFSLLMKLSMTLRSIILLGAFLHQCRSAFQMEVGSWLDKPAKLKSINNVSLIWVEECSEVKYEGFKELLGRLRLASLPLHMILSTNPVGEDNWTY